MNKVALTFYYPGGEHTSYTAMSTVPRVGDRLHAPERIAAGAPLRSWRVASVTWEKLEARDDPARYEWVPEVVLTQ